MPTHEPDRRETGPSLERILGLIDPGMLDVVVAPRGTGVPVTDVVLHDPGEEREDDGARAATGLILLAVGVEAASPEALDVLRAADRAGAAAVVMRPGARGPRAELVEAAGRGRTALLTRRPEQGWTEVLGRLRTALVHSDPAGTAGVAGLRPGDLSGLANTVAALVGGAITIEDPQSRVLAYSRLDHEPDPMRRLTILGQEVPRWRVDELRASGFFRTLWSTEDVVRLPADDRYAERLAIAVRHGSEVLGSIWAAADGRPLAEDAAAALRTAARAAVPHLSHHQTWGLAAARAREGAVHALLRGDVRSAQEAGVTADRPYAVVVAEAYDGRGEEAYDGRGADAYDGQGTPDGRGAGTPEGRGAGRAGRRVLDVLALQAAAYRPGCVTARSGRRLYVLVPAGDGETGPARTLLASARSVARDVVLAGAGPVAAGPAGLPASREAAELVVRVLRERAARLPAGEVRSAVAAYDEVVPEATVLRLLDRVEPLWGSLSGPVHAMVEHDRVHGSAYGDSVTAYLDASCDTGTAARRLNVHPNTLRYRLRRARELFGVDPADPAVRLLAEIGLRLAARRSRRTGSP
ncbi:helix-turn-helix domain-containing protein [Streptomyces sp. NBC_00257]|uniref:helix-turn-helix domain-containing protein n=1 Tax=unclassified Streptomyces TaxID=2593676 RepID=UPI00225C118D|nr:MULTISPECIES: helix-turn-helix domain-containing protein [unclassified Streptomyces]WTB55622.1 helix-turn-helix domain-containing protein [Streptomyces sp. NBC_00826]WTH91496.1 helix-turn-helix domain-containing protein [Streptomyces sp. NBC_00825]WTI00224.1 helix-turn-helix domain-containing protein [Streptomyces sp. NBC_00822]MCX4865726.1 helix-turn-helix domain-containing protein [Streptomyces sp. NBC_00906]MCX4896965.1 helix-turn-helix domain-containing protein [Streptomyces sp. NBC_008